MIEPLIYRKEHNSRPEICEFFQLENKCNEFLKDDEIRSAGIINNMGNLVAGGLDDELEWRESEELRRMLCMQMVLQISICKDFEENLGEIKYFAINRKKILMIAFPLKNNVLLISAKPTTSIDQIISKPQVLEFFELDI